MITKKVKNILHMLLAITLSICMLTACASQLKGTYTNNDELITQSFTFKENNMVEVSAFGISIEGEYHIENGTITITYHLLNFSYDWKKSFEKKGNSIYVDGIEFIKEK